MPQVYRRASEYIPTRTPSQHVDPPPPATRTATRSDIDETDDTIVLSGLVRTGEASRLRRRGAMRLDHGAPTSSGATRPAPPTAPSTRPPIVMPPSRASTPPWVAVDPSGEDEYTYGGGDWRDWNSEDLGEGSAAAVVSLDVDPRAQRPSSKADNDEPFVLRCGGDVQDFDRSTFDNSTPFQPSLLPRCPSLSSRPASRAPKKTNGCGAIVHMRAFPQRQRAVWVGKEEATEIVVALDSAYFERTVVAKMMKSACGCIREGIGCAVCGNALGTRYMPCQAASEGIFSSSTSAPSRSSRPLHPSGPRYWHCRPAAPHAPPRSSRSTGFYVYTFFSDHVSPSSTSSLSTSSHADEHIWTPAPPATRQTWFGYATTASPRSYSPYPPLSPPPPPLPPTLPSSLPSAPATETMLPPAPRPLQARDRGPPRMPLQLEFGMQEREDGTVPMVLDADGVVVQAGEEDVEPDSPDKTGNEVMLWPGR